MSRKRRVTRPLQDTLPANVKGVHNPEVEAGFDSTPESADAKMPEKFEGPHPSGMPEKFEQAASGPDQVVLIKLEGPYEAVDSGVFDRHGNRCAIGGYDHNRQQSGAPYARLIADALNAYKS